MGEDGTSLSSPILLAHYAAAGDGHAAVTMPGSAVTSELSTDKVSACPPHLAATENRVRESMHKLVETIQSRCLDAVQRAAFDIIQHLGQQAAVCIARSEMAEKRAALLERQHADIKEQTLQMVLRIKQQSDSQVLEADSKLMLERRRAQDAEAKLLNAQEKIKRLKSEVKKNGEILDEMLSKSHLADVQATQPSVIFEELDSRRRSLKLKGQIGVKTQEPDSRVRCKQAASVIQATDRTCCTSVDETVLPGQSAPGLSCEDGHCSTKSSKTAWSIGMFLATEKIELPVEGGCTFSQGVSGDSQGKESINYENGVINRGEVSDGSASPHRAPGDAFYVDAAEADVELLSEEPTFTDAQHMFCGITKDAEEDKSCLTMDALQCEELSLPVELLRKSLSYMESNNQTGSKAHSTEYVSGEGPMEEVDIQDLPDCKNAGNSGEPCMSGEHMQLEKKDQEKKRKQSSCSSPDSCGEDGTGVILPSKSSESDKNVGRNAISMDSEEQFDALSCLESLKNARDVPTSTMNYVIAETSSRDSQPDNESRRAAVMISGNPMFRGKRKVSSQQHVPSLTKEKAKQMDGSSTTGRFEHSFSPGRVEAQCLSSRDNRRLMQGARQLFSLADRKWR